MIVELKIELIFGMFYEDKWFGILEIDCDSVLERLHSAIQEMVCFDNDHGYEFYISRTFRSRDKDRFDDENGDIYRLKISDIFSIEKGRNLFYLFDYGDNWFFKITRTRRKEFEPVKNVKYPNFTNEIGIKPVQYPDQDC